MADGRIAKERFRDVDGAIGTHFPDVHVLLLALHWIN